VSRRDHWSRKARIVNAGEMLRSSWSDGDPPLAYQWRFNGAVVAVRPIRPSACSRHYQSNWNLHSNDQQTMAFDETACDTLTVNHRRATVSRAVLRGLPIWRGTARRMDDEFVAGPGDCARVAILEFPHYHVE